MVVVKVGVFLSSGALFDVPPHPVGADLRHVAADLFAAQRLPISCRLSQNRSDQRQECRSALTRIPQFPRKCTISPTNSILEELRGIHGIKSRCSKFAGYNISNVWLGCKVNNVFLAPSDEQ